MTVWIQDYPTPQCNFCGVGIVYDGTKWVHISPRPSAFRHVAALAPELTGTGVIALENANGDHQMTPRDGSATIAQNEAHTIRLPSLTSIPDGYQIEIVTTDVGPTTIKCATGDEGQNTINGGDSIVLNAAYKALTFKANIGFWNWGITGAYSAS